MGQLTTLLNVHTCYGDGYVRLEEIVAFCKAQGLAAAGIRDLDSMAAALSLERYCAEANLQPIYGLELTVLPLLEREQPKGSVTLGLIAENTTGFANLITLLHARRANAQGVPLKLLEQHSEGLLLLIGGLRSEVYRLVQERAYDEIERWFDHALRHWHGRLFFELDPYRDDETATILRGIAKYYEDLVPTIWQPVIRFASAQDRPLSEAWLSLQGTTQPLDGYALDEVSLKVKYEEVDSLLARVQPVSPSLVLRQASQQADEARTALEQLLREAWRIRTRQPSRDDAQEHEQEKDPVRRFWKTLPPLPNSQDDLVQRVKHELDLLSDNAMRVLKAMVETAAQAHSHRVTVHVRGPFVDSAIAYLLGLSTQYPTGHVMTTIGLEGSAEESGLDFAALEGENLVTSAAIVPETVWRATSYVPPEPVETWRKVSEWLVQQAPELSELARTYHNLLLSSSGKSDALAQTCTALQAHELGKLALQMFSFVQTRTLTCNSGQRVFVGRLPTTAAPMISLSEAGTRVEYDEASCQALDLPCFVLTPSYILGQIQVVAQGKEESSVAVYPICDDHELVRRAFADGRFEGSTLLQEDNMRELAHQGALKLGDKFSVQHLAVVIAGGAKRRARQGMQWLANLADARQQWKRSIPAALEAGFDVTAGVLLFREQAVLALKEGLGLETASAFQMLDQLRSQGIENVLPQKVWLQETQKRGWDRAQALTLWHELRKWHTVLAPYPNALRTAIHLWTLLSLRERDPLNFFFNTLSVSWTRRNTRDLATWIGEAQAFGIEIRAPDINVAALTPVREDNAIRLGLLNVAGIDERIATIILADREQMGPFKSIADFIYRLRPQLPRMETLLSLYSAGAFDNLPDIQWIVNLVRRHYAMPTSTASWEEIRGEPMPLTPALFWSPLSIAELSRWQGGRQVLSTMDEVSRADIPVTVLIEQARVVQTYRGEHMMFLQCLARDGKFNAVVFPQAFAAVYSPLCQSRLIMMQGRWDWHGRRFIVQSAQVEPPEPKALGKGLWVTEEYSPPQREGLSL